MNWISLLGMEGWIARWRANVIEGAIAAEDRLELARLEWADEKRRLGLIIVFVVALGGITVVALTVLSLAFIVQFWDSPKRAMVAWLLAGGWLVAWGVVLATLISVARKAGNAFALTRREIAHDWQVIKERL
ncbi:MULTISPECIES: phage holin family protein [unclassified Acidovorax]|uniref:phage holin family protein n=1 Tax=unclassified Acidovorax TaxID=2684926 RepID=UPI00288330BE|nr:MULTISPECIES: phage holin family protein [unclassified Acidovorax]